MQGFVDYFEDPGVLGGWASDGNRTPVILRAFHNSALIAEAETSFFRTDTGGNHGFRLSLSGVSIVKALIFREIAVFAVAADKSLVEVPLHPHILNKASLRLVRTLVMELDREQVRELASTLSDLPNSSAPGRAADLTMGANWEEPFIADRGNTICSKGLSYLGVIPGHVSHDRSAVIGKNGYLFILEGSNNLVAQYATEPDGPAVRKATHDWTKVIERRQSEFERRHIAFVQIIIPEKSSVVGESFPIHVPPETPLLLKLDRELTDRTSRKVYFSTLAHMRADPNRASIFRHMDSHLSPYGAWSIFRGFLESIDAPTRRRITFDVARVQTADLSSKFGDLPLREYVMHPEPSQFHDSELGLKRTEFELPPNGEHVGIRCVWTNTNAPVPLRVVAFGNSFFERGASGANLSWWAARWFREFHFIWSPFVDYDYIDRVAPDVVVCQTIERFLPMVPRA